MKSITGLSLFDGISCGQLALERAGIPVACYYASEIETSAIAVTQKHFPQTVQLGDVTRWREWNLPKIDLLIGGSPCQGFSDAGQGKNFADPRSRLFFEFADIRDALHPRYTLLENVKMRKQEWVNRISERLNLTPICINSRLVSAQDRERLYWTDIPGVAQPTDRGIMLKNVIDHDPRQGEPVLLHNIYGGFKETKSRVFQGKSPTLRTSAGGGHIPCVWDPDGSKKTKDGMPYRDLEPMEAECLQTLPKGYTAGYSRTARFSMIGNGWTVDVAAHIFKNLNQEEVWNPKPN